MTTETAPRDVTKPAPTGIGTFIWLSSYSAWRAMRRAPWIFLAAAVVVAAARLGVDFGSKPLESFAESSWLVRNTAWLGGLALGLAGIVITSFALAPVAIAVHRLVILNDEPKNAVMVPRIRHLAAWLIVMGLLFAAAKLPGGLTGMGGGSFLAFVATIAVAVIAMRCALIFPAVATDVPAERWKDRVEASWTQMRGHFLRLFFTGLGTLIVPLLIGVIVPRVATPMIAKVPALSVVFALIQGLISVTIFALAAGVTSWVYLWALDHPKAPSSTISH